ncbi:MAG: 2-succinyl-5-enolpyruvyl-6-hydroxy-3-cyclohexene-1-carboxylic-acid synthase [Myxococcales bacterium]|nr:2-succinyl-5-enolpyruvyl-6-hydroxy-3-cyclohexene-1-carboxylic-acid synthase [Myxococcales bacterium]
MNLVSAWASALLDALVAGGCRDLVMSPGSRSTPWVAAALRHEGVRCRIMIDERSAAFYAVGHAKVTGKPVALLCTSGSALAHYGPAVLEADRATVPLVILSADRPPELADCGAPQTIDQVKFFGDRVRWFFDLPVAAATAATFRMARRVGLTACRRATGPVAGPVHLNLRATKPLDPGEALTAEDRAAAEWLAVLRAEPMPKHVDYPAHGAVANPIDGGPAGLGEEVLGEVAGALVRAERPVLVAGPMLPCRDAGEAVREFATRFSIPLLAEAASQARGGQSGPVELPAFDVLLRTERGRAQFNPDFVLQVGGTPTSSGWARWLDGRSVPRAVVTDLPFADPQSSARWVLHGHVPSILGILSARASDRSGRSPVPDTPARHAVAWSDRIGSWSQAIRDAAPRPSREGLTEWAAAETLLETLPSDSLLALSNSLPIRHVDHLPVSSDHRLRVWFQRGTNGIDGLVAGALGAAVASGAPTALLLGDVALLHDLGAWLEVAKHPLPFVVLVLNNDGGRIFEQLPIGQAELSPEERQAWTTAHGRTFESVAAFAGVAHAAPTTEDELRRALLDAWRRVGPTLVEVRVDPHGARDAMEAWMANLEGRLGAP